ncbi:unnamed protein product [Owenia fusiformis]|uniref:Uncharacterized protein n=1 Tax=Owenia fusiformis TaxID=6347 RepID=A0A8J1TYQ2_OWEFU|nr:unnamed protein product [Owenia fusiformis]
MEKAALPPAWALFLMVVCIQVIIVYCDCSNNPCDDNADCTETDGSYTCACRSDYAGDAYGCDSLIVDFEFINGLYGHFTRLENKHENQSVWADQNATFLYFTGEGSWELSNEIGGENLPLAFNSGSLTPVSPNWAYMGPDGPVEDSVGRYPVRCVKSCTSVDTCTIEEPCEDENCTTISDIANGDMGFAGDGFCLPIMEGCTKSCDENATCVSLQIYSNDEIAKRKRRELDDSVYSVCTCDAGFDGDGLNCTIASVETDASTSTTEAAGTTGAGATEAAGTTGAGATEAAGTTGVGTTEAAGTTGAGATEADTTTGSVNTTGSFNTTGANNTSQIAGGSLGSLLNGLFPLGGSGASCAAVSLAPMILLASISHWYNM